MPEGGFPPVEGDAQGLGALLLQQPLEGGDEAVDGVGVQSVPGSQGPDAVKGAVDDAVAVDDHQFHGFLLAPQSGASFSLERVYHILERLQPEKGRPAFRWFLIDGPASYDIARTCLFHEIVGHMKQIEMQFYSYPLFTKRGGCGTL